MPQQLFDTNSVSYSEATLIRFMRKEASASGWTLAVCLLSIVFLLFAGLYFYDAPSAHAARPFFIAALFLFVIMIVLFVERGKIVSVLSVYNLSSGDYWIQREGKGNIKTLFRKAYKVLGMIVACDIAAIIIIFKVFNLVDR